jgi:hypothetical protein
VDNKHITDEPSDGRRLTTPKAAAAAGIIFALLIGAAFTLIRMAMPASPTDPNITWLKEHSGTVTMALSLVPFAGIAFLWFIGVIRDRIGNYEDRFFSTVFFGSALIYLAMIFAAAAIAAGLISSYSVAAQNLFDSGLYIYNRALIWQLLNIYSIRMSSVFMISLGTIWLRTAVMPRWLAFITYGSALVLMFSISYSTWVTLLFPAWVLVISLYILVQSLRPEPSTS